MLLSLRFSIYLLIAASCLTWSSSSINNGNYLFVDGEKTQEEYNDGVNIKKHHYDSDYVPSKMAKPPLMDPKPEIPKITHQLYMVVDIDGRKLPGAIVFGLFGDIMPKTVENFISLCHCDKKGKDGKEKLCYKDNVFHRIITNFMIQGGDISNNDGTGGMESIYNDGSTFVEKNEIFTKFNRRFLLAMSRVRNGKKNEMGSQFFVTTVKTQWLDNAGHNIFGIVLHGEKYIKQIEAVGTHGGKPSSTVSIVNCGLLEKSKWVDNEVIRHASGGKYWDEK